MVTKTPVQNRKIEKKVFPVVWDAYIWSEGPEIGRFLGKNWAKTVKNHEKSRKNESNTLVTVRNVGKCFFFTFSHGLATV